jgi:hypothetical protein
MICPGSRTLRLFPIRFEVVSCNLSQTSREDLVYFESLSQREREREKERTKYDVFLNGGLAKSPDQSAMVTWDINFDVPQRSKSLRLK